MDMCVLEDFEAITPNLLARTIETVQGSDLVVLLLKPKTSLMQLHMLSAVRSSKHSYQHPQNSSKSYIGCAFAIRDA